MACPGETHKSPKIDPKGREIYEMANEELGIIFLQQFTELQNIKLNLGTHT